MVTEGWRVEHALAGYGNLFNCFTLLCILSVLSWQVASCIHSSPSMLFLDVRGSSVSLRLYPWVSALRLQYTLASNTFADVCIVMWSNMVAQIGRAGASFLIRYVSAIIVENCMRVPAFCQEMNGSAKSGMRVSRTLTRLTEALYISHNPPISKH
jgi:hypothetical protein